MKILGKIKTKTLENKLQNYLESELNKQNITDVNNLSITPKDFAHIFANECKKINESPHLPVLIQSCIHKIIENNIKESVKIKKVKDNRNENADKDEESKKINDILTEKDYYKNQAYGNDNIGLKLSQYEYELLEEKFKEENESLSTQNYIELFILKWGNNKKTRKFCTKICLLDEI